MFMRSNAKRTLSVVWSLVPSLVIIGRSQGTTPCRGWVSLVAAIRRLALMPPFRSMGAEADEVQGNVLECGEIVGVVESDVHAPV